jgi:hypothetical protein
LHQSGLFFSVDYKTWNPLEIFLYDTELVLKTGDTDKKFSYPKLKIKGIKGVSGEKSVISILANETTPFFIGGKNVDILMLHDRLGTLVASTEPITPPVLVKEPVAKPSTDTAISDADMVGGLSFLAEDLLEGFETAIGRDKANRAVYDRGFERGSGVGFKLGRAGDPVKSLNRLIEFVSPFMKIKVVNTERNDFEVKATIEFTNCMVRKLIDIQGLPYPSIACEHMRGYVEGALTMMSGMHVKERVYESTVSKKCLGVISFTYPKDGKDEVSSDVTTVSRL